MRLLQRARSKTAAAIFALLSLAFQSISIEWWGQIPNRIQIGVLALGWLASAWLAMVALSYYLQCKLTLDDRGLLHNRENKPHCPACRIGLLVFDSDSYKCVVHGPMKWDGCKYSWKEAMGESQ